MTSSLHKQEKLSLYQKHFQTVPDSVLKYLQISNNDFDSLKSKNNLSADLKRDSSKDESDASSDSVTDIRSDKNDKDPSKMSRSQLVMSSRTKSLEELPSLGKMSKKKEVGNKTPEFKPRSKNKLLSGQKNKSKSAKNTEEDDIAEFIKDGEILYSKLIKREINKFDISLLEASKKANNIGGK